MKWHRFLFIVFYLCNIIEKLRTTHFGASFLWTFILSSALKINIITGGTYLNLSVRSGDIGSEPSGFIYEITSPAGVVVLVLTILPDLYYISMVSGTNRLTPNFPKNQNSTK